MKISIEKILQSNAALSTIGNEKMSSVLSYLIASLAEEFESIITKYHKEYQKLFEEMGFKNDKGDLEISKDNEEAFKKENESLLSIEEEIETRIPFKLLEDVKTSPAFIKAMKPFIDK
jgi:hypothetical protein